MADPGRRTGVDLRAYRALAGSRIRSHASYRTSFAFDLLGSGTLAVIDLIEVLVIFHNVPALGDLDLTAALLVFGLAETGFSLANLLCGHLDEIPEYLRTGTLEAMLLRPLPLLPQMITGDLQIRRISAALVSLVVLGVGLVRAPIVWTPGHALLLLIAPFTAAAIFCALFVLAGAAQFWLIDAAELTNSITYGSNYAAQFSSGIFPLPLRITFVFLVPAGFAGYLPAATVLGLPGPAGVPGWCGWFAPVVAGVAWLIALMAWRAGIRHYTGAGG